MKGNSIKPKIPREKRIFIILTTKKKKLKCPLFVLKRLPLLLKYIDVGLNIRKKKH